MKDSVRAACIDYAYSQAARHMVRFYSTTQARLKAPSKAGTRQAESG